MNVASAEDKVTAYLESRAEREALALRRRMIESRLVLFVYEDARRARRVLNRLAEMVGTSLLTTQEEVTACLKRPAAQPLVLLLADVVVDSESLQAALAMGYHLLLARGGSVVADKP